MASPILGFGTQLWVDRGGGFERIVKLLDIGEFGATAPDIDITNHDSTSGFREFLRGLLDGGDIVITGIWTGDATQVNLWTDIFGGPQTGNLPYKILLPQGYGEFDFSGYLKGVKIKPTMDGRLEFSGSAKISGKPSFTTTFAAGLTTPFFVVHDNGANASDTIPNPIAGTFEYVVDVDTTATTVTITPTAAVGTIKVNGSVTLTNTPSTAIALGAAQSLTDITITVSEANKADAVYSLTVARA